MNLRKFILLLGVILILFLQPLWSRPKLNPEFSPGGNFDLSGLQLWKITSQGEQLLADSTALQGKNGYSDAYFYTDRDDGAMTFLAPQGTKTGLASGVLLAEAKTGWLPNGNHALDGEVLVARLRERTQIAALYLVGRKLPAAELDYLGDDRLLLLLRTGAPEAAAAEFSLGPVKAGQRFAFNLSVSGSVLTLNIQGKNTTRDLPADWAGQHFYFGVGNLETAGAQTNPAPVPGALLKYYQLQIKHE